MLGVVLLPTEKKIARVEALREKLSQCTIAVVTDPTGLGVNTLNDLRQRLRERGIEYVVVKNTLTYLAADQAGVPHLKEAVQGPTALAFGYQDATQAAAGLEDYLRSTRSTLPIRGGILGARLLSAADVSALATLPPREQLVGQVLGQLQGPTARLLGQLQAPVYRLMAALQDPLSRLAFLLQQRTEQMDDTSLAPAEALDAGPSDSSEAKPANEDSDPSPEANGK